MRPIASTLRALFVRNLVANTYSLLRRFLDLDRLRLTSSSSVNDNFFQSYKISSSGIERVEREEIRPRVQRMEVKGDPTAMED